MASTVYGMKDITLAFSYLTLSRPYQDFRFLCCIQTPFIPKIKAVNTLKLWFLPTKMNGIIWMEASRCAYKRNITLNSVRQHNYFITQGNYIGYMFRL